jgi:hypothetical protein
MVKPLEGDGEAAGESTGAEEFEDDAAALAGDDRHFASPQITSDQFASPQFASDAVKDSIASPMGAKSAFHKTLSESAMGDLTSARTTATTRAKSGLGAGAVRSPVRALRIPVLAGTPRFFGWKAAAGVAVLAVVVLVMGAMRRKPTVPPLVAAPANEVQQNVPAAPAQTAPAVPTRSSSSPAQGSGSTTNSVSGARKVTKATSESTPVNPSDSKARAASEPKPPPKKQPNDGIKRYSDLD